MYKLLAISGLSLALLSGTAIAQVSVSTNGNLGVDANIGASVGDTNANVGLSGSLGVSGAGNLASDDSSTVGNASAIVDGNADVAADVNSDDGDTNINGNASGSVSTGIAANADDDDTNASVDSTTTASVDAAVNAAIDEAGDSGNGFFADGSRTTAASEEQIRTTFNALSEENQEQLTQACKGAAASDTSATGKICTAINAL